MYSPILPSLTTCPLTSNHFDLRPVSRAHLKGVPS